MTEALRVSQLAKSFTSYKKKLVGSEVVRTLEVLRGVGFGVGRHEFVSIVGPSGCGKSTALRIIAGIERATDGHVIVNGAPSHGPSRDVAMVFQNIGLYPWFTVQRNVQVALEFRATRGTQLDMRKLAGRYLEIVGLQDFAEYYPHQLSGGMQQRVGLARALVTEPSILLMDEPFGLLDAQTRSVLQDELLVLFDRLSQAVLFVTHDIDEAIYLSDRVIVMSGRPATVAKDVNVPLPRPRSPDSRSEPEFAQLRQEIWSSLRDVAISASRYARA